MALARATAAALVLLVCACSSSESPGDVDGGSIDFGVVWIGDQASLPLQVSNTGSSAVHLHLASAPAGFSVADLDIPAGGSAKAQVVFSPTTPGSSTGQARLDLGGARTLLVHVAGEGAAFNLSPSPATVDFGNATVGAVVFLPVTLHNPATSTVHLPLTLDGDAFLLGVSSTTLDVPGGGSADVSLGFRPSTVGMVDGTLTVGGCSVCGPLQIKLHGTGVPLQVTVTPSRLDFPSLHPGASADLPVTLHNAGTEDVNLDAALVSPADGPFATDASADMAVPAGGDLVVSVTFTPLAQGTYTAQLLLQAGGQRFPVDLSGSSQPGLAPQPDKVDLGRVPVGEPFVRTIQFFDEGSAAVTVTDVHVDPASSGFTATTDALPASIKDQPLAVTVTFQGATEGAAIASLVVVTSSGELRVPLAADAIQGGDCAGLVVPHELRFGLVHNGDPATPNLILTNTGADVCFVWDVLLDPKSSPRFTTSAVATSVVELAPDQSASIPLEFVPDNLIRQGGAITFRHEAGASVRVPVSGQGTDLLLSTIPGTLDFGRIVEGGASLLPVEIAVAGSAPARLMDVHPSLATPASFRTFLSVDFPRSIAPGQHLPFFALYRPTQSADESGEVEILVRGADEPFLLPIKASSLPGTCDASCTAPVVGCPGGVDAQAGLHAYVLAASQGPDAQSVSCSMKVVKAPDGSTAQPTSASRCSGTLFQPDLPGEYELEYAATYNGGDKPALTACRIPVHVLPSPGMWVETLWDTDLDIDQHFLNPEAGNPTLPATWTGKDLDAWAGNPTPSWNAPGVDDDPRMVADEDASAGIELLRLDAPVSGLAYGVGVRWTDDGNLGTAVNTLTTVVCDSQVAISRGEVLVNPKDAVLVGRVTKGAAGCTFALDDARLIVP